MIGLDRLMKVRGVVAAGQFAEDSSVIRKGGEMPEDLMESAELCVRQNHTSDRFLKSLNQQIACEFGSLVGWTVWGSKYSVVVIGNSRVFIF
jgi:roadblock/LC7 domain-containing protein